MIESNHGDTEEENMDILQLSSDSINNTSMKRPKVKYSEHEIDSPKKKQCSFNEQLDNISESDNSGTILEKNDTKDNLSQKPITSASAMSVSENEEESTGNEVKEIDKTIETEENNKENKMKKRHIAKKYIVDTEVINGLELSVERASDESNSDNEDEKDASSSDSEDEKDAKPRPKTIIEKAEPNESELDYSSEGEGKSDDSQQITDSFKISQKNKAKRKISQTSFNKLKTSESEDNQNSNSDEDYNPRTKKKIVKSPTMKKSTDKHRSGESKRGRGRDIRNSHKKSTKYVSDDENTATAEKANKTVQIKNGQEEKLSDVESSKSESDSNSTEENSMKSRKGRNNAIENKQIKQIKNLKKYLSFLGVRLHYRVFTDCRTLTAQINRLKEIIKQNGVHGRITFAKCKRAREEKAKMKEVSELDKSNIISEGRITRARRNRNNVERTLPDTSPRSQEYKKFSRIQIVIDSDSE
ncbi:PREDICTED: dentin sialophosphoprotein-like isoform X2 [Cyphomyrmex costatus]|uniref:dentin sialophosphoprotein-like isoform X2 n=1 Tax=Cyphomyrmex costatus TaxID=456900 RepID=UPI0008521E42|nr:PREDICTED: dentin sialophosphoprotein-like isoform X2 [Cyphomyrmex costatus]